ncbi:Alpha/Beta hydrolase protein [Colletotrichum navitas]|uniref:Alpha/Beta hydrolase protein n=1 Tax=Colletotrichum navitas TaxID=681940 RepID=A0AAD8Q1F6_9PEZI|nr:Alpha/Beta hydrolase protein [Colletotrichum navitas]KAK1593698.1 Alpha/Beta hydrolase protein [Colletotrichum navitas]
MGPGYLLLGMGFGVLSVLYYAHRPQKMTNLKFDAEFWAVAGPFIAVRPPRRPTNALELRRSVNVGLSAVLGHALPDGIVETRHDVQSFDGETIALYEFAPEVKDTGGKQPALIYVHGGGIVGGDIDPYSRPLPARAALETGLRVFAVEYRLAPEFPYPAPTEDCYAALTWLSRNAETLNIDPARIGFYALSAGGGMAAGAAMMARDRGLSPPLAKQILIYPMLDDRTRALPGNPLSQFLTWTDHSNQISWNAYLGEGKAGGPETAAYAAPARAVDVSNLPPTYIEVGGVDLFCAEAVAFASRLASANVQMELHVYPGLPHVFDLYAPMINLAQRARENRIRAAKSL